MMSWNETIRKAFKLNTEFNATTGLGLAKSDARTATIVFIFCAVHSDSDPTMSSIDSRAAESTNFKWLRFRLRLRAENIDSDSNSDSASTPAKQDVFHLKRATWCSYLLNFPFDWILTGDTVIINIAPVRTNCGCIRPWLSLISLNGLGMAVFEFVENHTTI